MRARHIITWSIIGCLTCWAMPVSAESDSASETNPSEADETHTSENASESPTEPADSESESESSEPDQVTIRGHQWGDSIEEVMDREGEPDRRDDSPTLLTYTDETLNNIRVMVSFAFYDDQLYQIAYTSLETYSTQRRRFKSDFEHLSGLLQDKYGTPDETTRLAETNGGRTDWETAFLIGDVTYADRWAKMGGDLRIFHLLTRRDDQSLHMLTYAYLPIKSEMIDESDEETQDKL